MQSSMSVASLLVHGRRTTWRPGLWSVSGVHLVGGEGKSERHTLHEARPGAWAGVELRQALVMEQGPSQSHVTSRCRGVAATAGFAGGPVLTTGDLCWRDPCFVLTWGA